MANVQLTEDGLQVRGRWDRVFLWHNEEDHQAYLRGEFVVPKWGKAFNNGITDEGIHYLLEAGFRSGTAIANWYAGLIDNSGFTGVDPSDTLASHSGWSESADYTTGPTRATMTFGAAATRTISAEVSFTMDATKTIEGIFVSSASTGTTGTLWSTALFASAPGLISGNVLTASYSLSD